MAIANLVPHPTEGANTFASLLEANTIAGSSLEYELWEALSSDNKTRWLLSVYRFINRIPDFVPPDEADECLKEAQVYIILQDLKYAISQAEPLQQVRIDKFDIMMTEYFKNEFHDRVTPSIIPDDAWPCLVKYGATQVMITSGFSTVRTTR